MAKLRKDPITMLPVGDLRLPHGVQECSGDTSVVTVSIQLCDEDLLSSNVWRKD